MRWTHEDMPRLEGRVALVTGANSGLGLVTARHLALHGATTILACRDGAKGRQALEAVERDGAQTARLAALDLADLRSVQALAAQVRADHGQLDLLVNNAGVMAIPRRTTADGFEMQLGTNHLGHFALTAHLFDLLAAAPQGRVVTVTSYVHHAGHMAWDDLHGARRYRPWQAYFQSKLANLLFHGALARRVAARGLGLRAVAAHPGYAATNLQHVGPAMAGAKGTARLFRLLNAVVAQDVERGALPSLYAATAPGANNGDLIGPDGPFETFGFPRKVRAGRRALVEDDQERLWKVSEELTGVRFEV